jgi:hypothetical protein
MKRQPTLEEYCQRYAYTDALWQAKKDVKDQLYAQGKRLNLFSAKEIHLMAEALIEADREAALTAAVGRLIRRYAKDRGMTVDDIAEAVGSAIGVGR